MAYFQMSPAAATGGVAPYRGSDPNQQMLAWALQNLGGTVQGLQDYYGNQRALDEQKMLGQLLGGTPSTQPQLPGAAPGDVAGFTPSRPGLAQQGGLSQQETEALLLMDPSGQTLMQTINARRPEPISPYQQAQLDLSKQGMGLEQQRMEQGAKQFEQSFRLQKAQLDAQTAYQNAKLRLDEAELGMQGRPKLSDVGGVRKEYVDASKDFVLIRDAHAKIQAAYERPSAASDVSMIFGYMKIVDPTSGVKEGEFATAQQTAGIPEQIVSLYNRAISGERLTEPQRADFMNQANALTRAQLDQQLRTETEFGDLAERYAIPRHDVTPDLIGDLRKGLPEIEIPSSPAGEATKAVESVTDKALGAVKDFFSPDESPEMPAAPPTEPRMAPPGSREGRTAVDLNTGQQLTNQGGQLKPAAPSAGAIVDGYRFKGGDPADPANWEPAS